MPVVQNARVYLGAIPEGGLYPEPGKDLVYDKTATIDTDTVLLYGGLLIKTLVLSVDPWQRRKMNFEENLGKSLNNFGIGRVIRSEHPGYQVGDYIEGMIDFAEYSVLPDSTKFRIINNVHGLPLSNYVGVAGMPGKTAYYAWKEWSQAKKGEICFVTTAAGAVGSIVVQFAKMDGCKVIASSGTDEKATWVKEELGADVSFNYKSMDTAEILEKEGPIDIYWDHVGGKVLDQTLAAAAEHARFIECGMMSSYNSGKPQEFHNLTLILYKRISLHGFAFWFLEDKYAQEFEEVVPKLVKEGKIKFREEITQGLHNAPDVILAQQEGKNNGKAVIIVAED